jgi:hypothetical protein
VNLPPELQLKMELIARNCKDPKSYEQGFKDAVFEMQTITNHSLIQSLRKIGIIAKPSSMFNGQIWEISKHALDYWQKLFGDRIVK